MILREDLEDLRTTVPSTVVRLLPAYDPWVMGPGTSDEQIVAPARRALVTRGANIVVIGGVVAGTWAIGDDEVAMAPVSHRGARTHHRRNVPVASGPSDDGNPAREAPGWSA